MIETMAYAGETPWHGLGVKVDEAMTSADAIKLAGLDWDVEQSPVSVNGVEVEGWMANIRSTDKSVLGITSDRYVPVQNRDAFDFTDAMIGEGARYETAGSLKEGKLVWLLALIGERKILGDEVRQYLTFATGHDGKTPVRVFDTNTRVVCNNTYQLALNSAKRVWTFEHSSGVMDRLRAFRETMENARDYMDGLEAKAAEFFAQKVDSAALDRILDQVFGDEDSFKDQPMKASRIVALKSRLVKVYERTDDLQNMRGTAWGVYNAFADVAAHGTPTFNTGKVRERRFLSYIEGNQLLKSAQRAIEAVAA
jgi:phage/plasmid-like protein (TIGR03299 family)